MNPNREGKTYRNKQNGAIILVVKSLRMSAGTSRHTVLVLDPADAVRSNGKPYHAGEQSDVDEVPVQKWDRVWEET